MRRKTPRSCLTSCREIVIKAQVHAGGRGKAGFVKLVSNLKDAEAAATFMLTNKMVSYQTGPDGLVVKKLLIAAAEAISKEYYLAITIDRARRTVTSDQGITAPYDRLLLSTGSTPFVLPVPGKDLEGVIADHAFEVIPGSRISLCHSCKGYHRFKDTLFKVD